MPLSELSAVALRDQIRQGQTTAEQTARRFLSAIGQRDEAIGAFLHCDEDLVLRQALELDRRRQAGQPLGPLAGLPIAIKDVFCTVDMPTTCGSRFLQGYRSPFDATVVARLRQADAVLIGKTNMDEFAMGGSTENSAYQLTRNPWDPQRVPGGSSGGAAACLAADMCPLSLGTDTGGSVRQPAAFCGVTGLKPTYGRVSRYGLVAFASSLDQAGPLARSAEDVALLLDAISGHDALDATSSPRPGSTTLAELNQPLTGIKLGVLEEHASQLDAGYAHSVAEAIKVLKGLGAELHSVSLPHQRYGVAAYYVIAPCEASSNLARFTGAQYGRRSESLGEAGDGGDASPLLRMYCDSRAEGFGREVKRRIMLGTYALSAGYYDAYYLQAQKVRRLIRDDFLQAFEKVDLLIGPSAPSEAFCIGERTNDPLAMYLGDLFTVGANLAGVPALSMPCGFSSAGLPWGLQLQGPPFSEGRLLAAAHAYQRVTDWHRRRPARR